MNLEDDKIVCRCFQVSVKDLKEAIKDGHKTFEDIQEVTSVGTGCGSCVEYAKKIIEEIKNT